MNKFRVGDKVIRTGQDSIHLTKGKIYTITYSSSNEVRVEDIPFHYHPEDFEYEEESKFNKQIRDAVCLLSNVAGLVNGRLEISKRSCSFSGKFTNHTKDEFIDILTKSVNNKLDGVNESITKLESEIESLKCLKEGLL